MTNEKQTKNTSQIYVKTLNKNSISDHDSNKQKSLTDTYNYTIYLGLGLIKT